MRPFLISIHCIGINEGLTTHVYQALKNKDSVFYVIPDLIP